MKFSIIIPVYNNGFFIKECLDSVLFQNYCDYEIVLVDDGSTDSSALICDQYAQRYSNIQVFHKKNGGSTSARKLGAEKAKGEYIVCIDSDDYVNGDFLQTISNLVESKPDVLCIGYKKNGKKCLNSIPVGLYQGEALFDTFLVDLSKPFWNSGCLIYGIVTKVVKRELFLKNQLSISDCIVLGEDALLSGLIVKNAKSVIVSDYCGYEYRNNERSITNLYSKKMISNFTNTCEEFVKIFSDNKVYLFALSNLFNIYSLIAKQSKKYSQFINELKNVDYCKGLKKFSNKAVIRKAVLRMKIKIMLDRHNCFRLMYLLYR